MDHGPAGWSTNTRHHTLTFVKVLLDWGHRHGTLPGLPANAVIYEEEVSRPPDQLPRFIPEFVMNQLESDANLARLRNPTVRHLVVLLMETGLRGGDACVLPFNPIVEDSVGWPCLRFDNSKVSAEQLIPLSAKAAATIRAQQAHVLHRWPAGSPWLFPGIEHNPDGAKPYAHGSLSHQLGDWQKAIDLRDEAGQPVRVHAHQFRHTVGTRLINAGVPQHVIQKLLGHASPRMTARYAQIHDHTIRDAFERYCANGSTPPASISTTNPTRSPPTPSGSSTTSPASATASPTATADGHRSRTARTPTPASPAPTSRPPPSSSTSTAARPTPTGGSSPAPTPTASSVSPRTSGRSKPASTASSPRSKPLQDEPARDPRRQHPPPLRAPQPLVTSEPSRGPRGHRRRSTAAGQPVTFTTVAREAGVSRGWLYTQPDLRDTITRIRAALPVAPSLPSAQRTTPASLRQRLDDTRHEITRLRAENALLRDQLARQLGDERTRR